MSPYVHSIIADGDDDQARILAQLGVAADELRRATLGGYMRGRECTSNHPRIAPGFDTWSETVALLREIKVPQGWAKRSVRNYETVEHPDRVCAIAVAGGTHETGTAGTPHTRTPKGVATEEVVERNQQLTLFGSANEPASSASEERPETWLLLHYYDHVRSEIRCELSLPLEMFDKTITAWKDRILLAPMPFTMDDRGDDDDEDFPDEDDPIDVHVPRRPR
jgi:hypothetical protein